MDLWFKINMTGLVILVFTFLVGNIFCKENGVSTYVRKYPWFWIPAGFNFMFTAVSSFCYAIALIWV